MATYDSRAYIAAQEYIKLWQANPLNPLTASEIEAIQGAIDSLDYLLENVLPEDSILLEE